MGLSATEGLRCFCCSENDVEVIDINRPLSSPLHVVNTFYIIRITRKSMKNITKLIQFV